MSLVYDFELEVKGEVERGMGLHLVGVGVRDEQSIVDQREEDG